MSGFTEKLFYAIIKINVKMRELNRNRNSAFDAGDRENKGRTKE